MSVNAFSALKNIQFRIKLLYKAPANSSKTYLFYGTVHLMKNIRNIYLVDQEVIFAGLIYTT